MRQRFPLCLVLGLLVHPHAGVAGIFHVAPTGDDAAAGTAEQPFASIIRARDAARPTGGRNTILLAPGRYFNERGIVLDERDSGLTIKGATTGAVAEVYGGVPVTGWERWKGNIWRAPVPKARRFFNLIVDGKPATMAQTPNLGSGYGGGVSFSNNRIVVPPAWRGYDYADAQVACFVGSCWFNEMREVKAAKPDANGALPIDPGRSFMFRGLNKGMSVVRGVLELLDDPGEWCLKRLEGFVYYWPESGTPMDHVIVRPTAVRLFDVHGTSPQTPVSDVTLENLSLIGSDFAANWRLFAGEPKCNSQPEETRQGLVFGENVESLKVSACRILAAGHSGVFLNLYARDCVIENSVIARSGVYGIFLNGWPLGEGPFKSLAESYVNKGHRIVDNFIYDGGRFIPTAGAIEVFQSGDLLISRNEIAEAARCGIMLRGVRWGVIRGALHGTLYGKKLVFKDYFDAIHTRNIRIIGNDIYNVCRNTDDFGAIESWGVGRGNLWENNVVHDFEHAQRWDTWGHALFVDDSSHYCTVRGNIVHHFYGGRSTAAIMVKNIEQVVENNLVVDCGINRPVTFSPYMEPCWEVTIRHNIFASQNQGPAAYAMNDYCLTGKPFLDAVVPPGAKGIREVDYNWIVPQDPGNPNPLAEKYKVDLHSTFGPAPIRRLKPDWDIQAGDYQITPVPKWWQPIDCSGIGLTPEFPFDRRAVTRRRVGEKIQAEAYQRRHDLHARGGSCIYAIARGSWAKYANLDFGNGATTKAVFELSTAPIGPDAPKPFIRRYGSETVEEIPFKGDKSVETITCWEISKPYTKPGKTGAQLFDDAFPPEADIKADEWSPYLRPVTSKQGVTSPPGVVDFYVANDEDVHDACAYARASVWAQTGRHNATMTITCADAAKVWLNGKLVISGDKPGTYSETRKCNIGAGWNTILVKVVQGPDKRDFRFKFGTVASSCGHIVFLPGLPTDEHALSTGANTLVELRLDSPEGGKLIGALPAGASECPLSPVNGIHNLYLVFPGNAVRSVDWFRLER